MSQVSGNQIAEGVVKITADTKPALDSLDRFAVEMKAKFAEMRQGITQLEETTKAAASGGVDPVRAAAIAYSITQTAEKAFALGKEIRAFYDSLFPDPARLRESLAVVNGTFAEQTATAKENVRRLQKELADTTEIEDFFENTLGIGNRQASINAEISAATEDVRRAESFKRKETLAKELEEARAANLEGVEKIENDRAAKIREIRAKHVGENVSELLAEVNKKYDHEIKRFNELEARKKEAEDERAQREQDALAERKNAYNDFIQHQKMKDREAADALAASLQRIATDASKQMAQMFDMSKISMTLAAIEANTAKLARQRQAQGV